jgi:hypothetical protein
MPLRRQCSALLAAQPFQYDADRRREAQALKEIVANFTLENRLLKKSMIGDGGDEA